MEGHISPRYGQQILKRAPREGQQKLDRVRQGMGLSGENRDCFRTVKEGQARIERVRRG